MSGQRFVGFYWTLPVPWAQFNALPVDVDAAAEKSRSIRYQRDRVRRWVKENGGILIKEQVFLELAPDRATKHVKDAVQLLARTCREARAMVVHVNFHERHHARPHPFLRDALKESGTESFGLDPEPIVIDGSLFDPIEHFRGWRKLNDEHTSGKPAAAAKLLADIHRMRDEGDTWARVAENLNRRGLKTLNGKPWRAENARKFTVG